ncbi:MAG: FKBP-type peptidyl-prolyl cis-trans isomerase [Lewinellaceae bacterium]|nr:FKBP-type peptidyl-prolyl cis-trans isomerase [Saprospiraceae bacterium]MCB9315854.1 FKBP-type peptidyl-prolyl cis-trans isomerase [Lewinellaceae bacterium]MCB9330617.1 FKBP-type peptidyl-prolyl cis-trans isomerase [Lewinellaceae bacterium]
MKKTILFLVAVSISLGLQAQTKLETMQDSASYAFGVLVGKNLQRQLPEGLNVDVIMAAMTAALKNEDLALDQQAATQCFTSFNTAAQAKAEEKNKAQAEQNKVAGDKFLAENKKRKEIMTTASGLQYEVLSKGTGTESPKATDRVRVHYHGTTIDGGVFDSSVERGEPITFGLNQVIKGWTEGLQLMKVGDKFKFYIPADLAYGDNSPSPKIPPGSVLVFEVELFDINPEE